MDPILGRVASIDEQRATKPLACTTSPVTIQPSREYPLILKRTQIAAEECFGALRSRLLTAHRRRNIHSVLISSPAKGEGKTLTAINLGLSLGQMDQKRVLLVDGDLRMRSLSALLGLQSATGLGEYLQGTQDFNSVVHPTSYGPLYVVGAGNPAEELLPKILEGGRCAEFVRTAEEYFDLIVMDALPVTAPMADFELLASVCDALILVVQLRKTAHEALTYSAQKVDREKLLGIVVNNASRVHNYDYGYYYHKRPK